MKILWIFKPKKISKNFLDPEISRNFLVYSYRGIHKT